MMSNDADKKEKKWQAAFEAHSKSFEIIEDPLAGCYLYVFENGKCTYDHLQDTFEVAIESAWEDYNVPKNAWKRVC